MLIHMGATRTQHRSCDDLLPILLYVVIKSKLETVHTESMYMQDFIGTPPYHPLNVKLVAHAHAHPHAHDAQLTS
jgi:hypothetical protein